MRDLQDIYHNLLATGIIHNQRHFGTLLGMSPSWCSSKCSKKQKLNIDNLWRLSVFIHNQVSFLSPRPPDFKTKTGLSKNVVVTILNSMQKEILLELNILAENR